MINIAAVRCPPGELARSPPDRVSAVEDGPVDRPKKTPLDYGQGCPVASTPVPSKAEEHPP